MNRISASISHLSTPSENGQNAGRAWLRALPLLRADHLWGGLLLTPVMALMGCTTYIFMANPDPVSSIGRLGLLFLLLSPLIAYLASFTRMMEYVATDRWRQLAPRSHRVWGEVRALVWMGFAILPPLIAVGVVLVKVALGHAPVSDTHSTLSLVAVAALAGSLSWRTFNMRIGVAACSLSAVTAVWAIVLFSLGVSATPPLWLSAILFVASLLICALRARRIGGHAYLDGDGPLDSVAAVATDAVLPPVPLEVIRPARGWAASPWRWLVARSLGAGFQRFYLGFALFIGFMIGWNGASINGALLGLAMGTQGMSMARQRQWQLLAYPIPRWWRLSAAVLPMGFMMLLGTSLGLLTDGPSVSRDDFGIERSQSGTLDVLVPMVGWDLAWGPAHDDFQRSHRRSGLTLIHINPYAVAPTTGEEDQLGTQHLEALQRALSNIAGVEADLPLLESAVYQFEGGSLKSNTLKELLPQLNRHEGWRRTWRSRFLMSGVIVLCCMLLSCAAFEHRPAPGKKWGRAMKVRLFIALLFGGGILAVLFLGEASEFSALFDRVFLPMERLILMEGPFGLLVVLAGFLLAFYLIGRLWFRSEFRHPCRPGDGTKLATAVRSAQ